MIDESCVAIDLIQQTMDLDRRYALYIQKLYHIYHTSRSAGVRIRASIFSRCNDTIVRTKVVPLLHVSCDIMYKQSLHAINDLIAVGQVRNLLCGHSSYQQYILTPPRANFWICHWHPVNSIGKPKKTNFIL